MSGMRTGVPGVPGVPGADTGTVPAQAGNAPRRLPRITPPRRRTVLIVLAALTVLLGGGTWVVYGSPWLRAEHVSVRGTRDLTAGQVEHAAAVPLGGPLVSVDTGAVRRRLLARLPRVAAVRVRRSWPHTVVLDVTERTAAAVVKDGSRFTEVDGTGVRFATVDRMPAGVPLVQLAPDRAEAAASLRLIGPKRLLEAAIEVAADLPPAIRQQSTAIRVLSYDGIQVELTGGREVLWGSPERGAAKATVLGALMKAEPHARHYDVSAPTAPAAMGS